MSRVLGGIYIPQNSVCVIYISAVWLSVLQTSLQLLQVSTVLVSTWMWPVIRCPEFWMTITTLNSAHVTNTSVYQENTSVSQEFSSSEQETEMQSPSFQPSTSQAQFVPCMFMPYIEGPKMDWIVNDGLYHRFLKWKLKCENILDCELAMLPESKKCKKVIAWSGDFGIDQ